VPNFIPRFVVGFFFFKNWYFSKKMIIYFEKSHFWRKKRVFRQLKATISYHKKVVLCTARSTTVDGHDINKKFRRIPRAKKFLFENKNSPFFPSIFFRNFFFHFFQIVWNACKKIFSKFFFVQLSKNTWKKTRKFSKKCNMTPSIWDICAKKLVVTKVNKAVILIITKQILG
jgi:hypothetical protein